MTEDSCWSQVCGWGSWGSAAPVLTSTLVILTIAQPYIQNELSESARPVRPQAALGSLAPGLGRTGVVRVSHLRWGDTEALGGALWGTSSGKCPGSALP